MECACSSILVSESCSSTHRIVGLAEGGWSCSCTLLCGGTPHQQWEEACPGEQTHSAPSPSCFTAHHEQGDGSAGAVSELPSLAFRFTVKSVTIFWEHLVREWGIVNTTNPRCSGRWLEIRRKGERPSQEHAGSPATVSKRSVLWSVCGLYVCAAISDGYHSNTYVLWYTFCLVKYKHTEVLGSAFPKKESLLCSRLSAHTPQPCPWTLFLWYLLSVSYSVMQSREITEGEMVMVSVHRKIFQVPFFTLLSAVCFWQDLAPTCSFIFPFIKKGNVPMNLTL